MTFPAQLISFINSQQDQVYYNTVGTFTTIVPSGVTMMSAVAIGGGGGGAGNNGSTTVGTGGGGGGGTSWSVFSVTPGDVLEIKVGAGGNGGTTTGNGSVGDFSHVTISSRTGVPAAAGTLILRGNGGGGGTRVTGTGVGGAGGVGNDVNTTSPYFTTYLRGGGNGGAGGSSVGGGAATGSGGGGAGGYTGNGGTGGRTNTATQPTAGSGGGGGGGGGSNGSSNSTGYGGGGIGAYGYNGDPVLDGSAGVNDTGSGGEGGGGGSFYNDPGTGINAALVGETYSTTGTISLPVGIQTGDFLLLLSGADKDGGVLNLDVPTGFTTISKSNDGLYTVSNISGAGTETIPSNVTSNPTKDINFASSYRYVPTDWGTVLGSSISGLNSPAIHNLIGLRYIPNPATIAWATESGDPAINTPSATEMPDPPAVLNIPEGAVSIALGFLANTVLNPSNNIAGANSSFINVAEGGTAPTGVGLVASYYTAGGGAVGSTINPDAFLTGTAAHSRSYTIQVNRTNSGTPVTFIDSAKTGTPAAPSNGLGPASGTSIRIPDTVQNNDLVVVVTSSDNPGTPSTHTFTPEPTYAGGAYGSSTTTLNLQTDIYQNDIILVASSSSDGTLNTPTGYTSLRNQTGDANNPSFRLSAKRVGASVDTTVSGLSASSSTGAGTVHVALIVRGVSPSLNIASISSSLATAPGGGTNPNPPALTATANDTTYFVFAFLDEISTTAATAPGNYTTAINAAVGIDETGTAEASIFTAYREQRANGTAEDPGTFGNIPDTRSWAAITVQFPPDTTVTTSTTINVFEAQTSRDIRGGGGLGFRISYFNWVTGSSKRIDTQLGNTNTPSAHMVIILRGATWAATAGAFGQDQLTPTGTLGTVSGIATGTAVSVFDNGSQIQFGPPDPPPLVTVNTGSATAGAGGANSFILTLGFIDNVTTSNVIDIFPPTDYTMLAKQSYGTNNNGAIIMSAIRLGLVAAASEDPTNFVGNGANIWASQTIIIGGPGGENTGTNLAAGQFGGGGGSAVNSLNVAGMKGASGAVRLIWGNTRQYPASNQGNTPIIDWTP